MIDIHSHILPGLDDGAAELPESLRICQLAVESGCETMIATPHQRHPTWWNAELIKLEILLNQLQRQLGDTLDLHLGAEIRVGRGFVQDLENFDNSGLASLAGSDYLLLEFERRELSVDPLEIIQGVREAGWRPIVAHPEFITEFSLDSDVVTAMVDAGALTQITAMSVTGEFGSTARQYVESLLDEGLAHFVASDCHGERRRPPGLERAFSRIEGRWGRECAMQLTVDNPRAVIENRPVGKVAAAAPSP